MDDGPQPAFSDPHDDDYREAIGQVEELAERTSVPDARWIDELGQRLPRLEQKLREHFGEERDGPLYRELPLKKPRFAERLERLRAEHDEILERAQRVARRVEARPEAGSDDLRELHARLRLLVASIRRHEAEEIEVIMQAHWQEFGTGD